MSRGLRGDEEVTYLLQSPDNGEEMGMVAVADTAGIDENPGGGRRRGARGGWVLE